MADERLFHHDVCFGCGQANLFGLQVEVSPAGEDEVAGRFFVKQDHQGPPGSAHGGVIAAALDEAMALLIRSRGVFAPTARLEVDLVAPAPVGAFVDLRARLEGVEGRRLEASAEAMGDGGEAIARARGVFVELRAGA